MKAAQETCSPDLFVSYHIGKCEFTSLQKWGLEWHGLFLVGGGLVSDEMMSIWFLACFLKRGSVAEIICTTSSIRVSKVYFSKILGAARATPDKGLKYSHTLPAQRLTGGLKYSNKQRLIHHKCVGRCRDTPDKRPQLLG